MSTIKYLDENGLARVKTNIDTKLATKIGTTDYASTSTAGVIKKGNSFNVNGSGVPYADELSYADYQTYGSGRFIGKGTLENVLTGKNLVNTTDLATKQDVIQYSTMPTASNDNLGKIVQYIGTTNSTYTNGYFYQCVSDGQSTPTYSWTNINVQESGGGSSIPQQDTAPSNPSEDDLWIDTSSQPINNVYSSILWTNPNPTSSMSAQNITLNNSNYDMYECFYIYDTTSSNVLLSSKSIKGKGFFLNGYSGYYGVGSMRLITYTNSTTLHVEQSYGNSTTPSNNYCIPLYIVGYNIGLFN